MSTGWEVELVVGGELPTLPGPAKVEIVRVVQEALANARRHSGARRVEVVLGVDSGLVWVEVRDDGCGFDPEKSPGMGLTGMRERTRSIGGDLEVWSEPGRGAKVRLRVPLSHLDGEDRDTSGT